MEFPLIHFNVIILGLSEYVEQLINKSQASLFCCKVLTSTFLLTTVILSSILFAVTIFSVKSAKLLASMAYTAKYNIHFVVYTTKIKCSFLWHKLYFVVNFTVTTQNNKFESSAYCRTNQRVFVVCIKNKLLVWIFTETEKVLLIRRASFEGNHKSAKSAKFSGYLGFFFKIWQFCLIHLIRRNQRCMN